MTHQYPPTNHRNDVTRIDSEFCFSSSPFIENLNSTILKYIYSISAHSMAKKLQFCTNRDPRTKSFYKLVPGVSIPESEILSFGLIFLISHFLSFQSIDPGYLKSFFNEE